MSDVRALLKAKRQEARIDHPYASYNSSGQLKCLICGTTVKHASAWEGHLGSKPHRVNVVREREEERLMREKSKTQASKEDVNADQKEEEQPQTADSSFSSKRRLFDDSQVDEHAEKRRKLEKKNLPVDFFSDPSRAPVLSPDDSDEDDTTATMSGPQRQPDVPQSAIDLEYELFQRELTKTADSEDVYNRATIMADAVVASTTPVTTMKDEVAEPTEEEIRRKHEQEEKELIMDRLLEEERAQEDADTRVLLLKKRVELLRKRRQVAKSIAKPSI